MLKERAKIRRVKKAIKRSKIAQGAETFSAGAFAGQYEQPAEYQPKKSSRKSKSRKTSQKTEPQYTIGIDTGNILQYTRRIL